MSAGSGGRLSRVGAVPLLFLVAACGEGPIEPPPLFSLELGELRVLRGSSEVRSFRLSATDGSRSYLLVVQNAGRSPGSLSMTLTGRGEASGDPAETSFSSSSTPAAGARASGHPGPGPRAAAQGPSGDAHLLLRRRMREALDRAGARPSRIPGPEDGLPAAASIGAGRVPAVGDTLRIRMAIRSDLSADCQDTSRVLRAVVRAVGRRFALAEDLEVQRGFTSSDWEAISGTLDDVVFPVDSAYFGAPADLDGNGRVVVLVTPEVNRMTPRGSQTLVLGFFWPGDLSDPASCPASNRAEILYLLAPDPLGRHGAPRSIASTRQSALQVVAHELEHLLSAQQRITLGSGGFASLEQTWLSEGMAHVAEEVVGLRATGQGLRRDLARDDFSGPSAGFDTYLRTNFERLAWHLRDPGRTAGLAVEDPTGIESLAMRGNAWIFLRWLADRFAPAGGSGPVPGADEVRLFRELSSGGPSHVSGVANVERALAAVGGAPGWEELVARFAPVLALDDAGNDASAEIASGIATWNLREVFRSLHEEASGEEPFDAFYPLQPVTVAMSATASVRFDLELRAFGARYFTLESPGPSPAFELGLATPEGTALPSSAAAQVMVVRVR